MKADYWRQGVAAILAAGLLAVGAVAQEGAEGEVNITEGAPTETAQPAEAEPAAQPKPIKPQIVDRDPFVNQLLTGNVTSTSTGTRSVTRNIKPVAKNAQSGSTVASAAGTAAAGEEAAEEVEIPAPEVSVTGIVSSGTGKQAIIKTNVGMRVINVGQKLGDYRVAAIGTDHVVFNYGGEKNFKVPLDSEF
ncbi:MAG: hypothetical protein WC314_28065 [Vulcanimicrobiota bacterium]